MIITYKIKHHLNGVVGYNFQAKLQQAKTIANAAIQHRNNRDPAAGRKRYITSKGLKEAGANYDLIGSTAACSIVKKYISNPKLKRIKKMVIPIPYRNGKHLNFTYDGQYITIQFKHWILPSGKQPKFYWKPGKPITNFCQMEINSLYIYLSVEIPEKKENHLARYLGIDVNATHHIAVAASPYDGKVYKFDKKSSNIRKKYFRKMTSYQSKGQNNVLAKLSGKVKRIMRNADHVTSHRIVSLAKRNKMTIVLERLTGLRDNANRNRKLGKNGKRTVNSWSFYRLQSYICYKAKLSGIKVIYIDPAYTSQECSRCGAIKKRDLTNLKKFYCPNKKCKHKDHADANAAFNIAYRGQTTFIEETSDKIAQALLTWIELRRKGILRQG